MIIKMALPDATLNGFIEEFLDNFFGFIFQREYSELVTVNEEYENMDNEEIAEIYYFLEVMSNGMCKEISELDKKFICNFIKKKFRLFLKNRGRIDAAVITDWLTTEVCYMYISSGVPTNTYYYFPSNHKYIFN